MAGTGTITPIPGPTPGPASTSPYLQDYTMTILPLDYFRRFVSVDPYHFWQMSNTGHPERGYSHVYPHNRWQYTERVATGAGSMPGESAKRGPGRYDMLEAIAAAESKIASVSELDTWPGPMYTEDETVILKKPKAYSYWWSRETPYGLLTRWKKVQYVGLYTWTAIRLGATLVYDATDDVVTAVTTSVDEDEVVACYPGTYVPIRPINISVSGTTMTITIKKWLLADPDLWDTASVIDATDTTNLLSAVDVYRVHVDPSDQILVAWEPDISYCECLNTEQCELCAHATMQACAFQKNYKIGFVGWQVGEWNATSEEYERVISCYRSRFPDKAYINYQHGQPLEGDRYMSRRWQRIVCMLAAAELPDYVYDATSRPDAMYYWRTDFAQQEGLDKHQMSMSDLDNPFGTKRGQIMAWKEVKRAIGD